MKSRYSFVGGKHGIWRVTDIRSISGSSLELVERVNVVNDVVSESSLDSSWILHSFISNVRYSKRDEVTVLRAI
jgi:hypothetical protein